MLLIKNQFITDPCVDRDAPVSIGGRACVAPIESDISTIRSITNIYIRQLSSKYGNEIFIYINTTGTVAILQHFGDWLVDFNITRSDQMLRLVQLNVTCRSIGPYILTVEYDNLENKSFAFNLTAQGL